MVVEWAQELMNYSQYEVEWVWHYIREYLKSRDSEYPPPLNGVLTAVGIAHARKNRYDQAALPAPEEERIDIEDASKRIAEIKQIISDKLSADEQPEPKFNFETASAPTSDDLEGE